MSKSGANATTMAAKPMLSADELEAYLRARGRAAPVSCLDGLDGYLTAVLIGPKFIDPQLWLGQLLGERALLATEETREYLAIQAVAHHHNRLSETMAQFPYLYRPQLPTHHAGGLDPIFWSLGFLMATRLAPRAWKSMANPDKPEHATFQALHPLLISTAPIADADVPALAKAILDLREHFKARRNRSMR
ncbi:YecA family protein [Azospirillum sp. A23]|uniref:YecA/YgfB family protein n=1 Tax=Azospirillum sp. A23 TaxID=3160608 RepID=UPI0036F29D86